MAAAQLKLRVWLKLLCGLVFVFGVVVPCILLIMAGTNFDTAHVPLQHQSVASKSHERKPLDYADVPDSAGALKFQISELENIRLSVRNELRVMDRDRQRLAGEVESARQALAVLKKDIEKAKIELQNTRSKLSRAVRQVKRASDEPPTISSAGPVVVVSLPASSQSKVQPLPQAVAVDGKQRVFCTQEACLDHSRCPLHKAFLVYVYNENRPYSSLFPLRDNQVLKGFLTRLREVGTLTSDPELACLFVVVVGPLLQPLSQSLLEERLHSLPTWTASQAANHLLIDIPYQGVATPLRGIDIGRAILAHGLAQQWDILLPPVTRDDDKPLWQGLPLHLPAKRQNLVYFEGHQSQKESLSDLTAADLDSITSALAGRVQDKLFIRTSCPSVSEQVFPGEWALCGSPEERHSHLSLTTFSLVLGSGSGLNGPTTYTRLVEALRYGAIPVVIGVGRLPLETVINWNLAVVTIPTSQVGQLHLLLKSYTDEKILSFRRQGRYLWETFFSSPGRMLDSVISLLRSWFNHPPPVVLDYSEVTRLVSIPGGNRQVPSPIFQYNFTTYTSEFWNSPPGPFYMYPSTPFQPSPVSGLRYVGLDSAHIQGLPQHIIDAGGITGPYFEDYLLGNLPEEQFTVVMLTYERNSVLLQALDRLSDLDSLSKVIVMWNNPSPPSADMPWPDIGVPLEVVSVGRNSLNNRFLPLSMIETNAVLSIDDDVSLRHDEIQFAFRVWREAQDRVVGFPGRFHAYDVRYPGKWLYNSNYTCELSMVLTGAAFIHKYYLYLYSQWLPQTVRDTVDKFVNCEDIAMNFLVSHITRKPPLKVTSRWTFRCPGCPDTLSTSEEHFNERHICINQFTEMFGYMPLLYTQFRADSILFKTRLPSYLDKCYQYV